MQEQAKLSLSSKGKAREDVHWQLGWWDFAHALEGTRRSVEVYFFLVSETDSVRDEQDPWYGRKIQ